MPAPPSDRVVRAGALAMMAAGNTLETVAGFFGVAVDVLRALLSQPVEALPPDVALPAQPWHQFPGPIVYRCPNYALIATLGIMQIAVGAVGWVLFSSPRYTGPVFISTWLVFAIGYSVALALAIRAARINRFVMGRDAIAGYTQDGCTVLPYAAIVSYVKEVKNGRYCFQFLTCSRAALSVSASVAQTKEKHFAAWLKSIPASDNTLLTSTPSKMLTMFPILISTCMILLFSVRTGLEAVHAAHASKLSAAWPTIDGIVIKSVPLTGGGKGCRNGLRFQYTYRIAQNQHVGTTYQFGRMCSADVKQIAAANPVGKHLPVHYRPDHPLESVIVPGLVSRDMAFDMFEMLLMMSIPAFFLRYWKEK